MQVIKLLIMYFSPLPCYRCLLMPKYPPQPPILKYLQPKFLPQYQRPRLTLVQNNRLSETSVRNYHYSLRNNPEECSSQGSYWFHQECSANVRKESKQNNLSNNLQMAVSQLSNVKHPSVNECPTLICVTNTQGG